MAAQAVTDYLFAAKPLWTGTIGSGGVADSSVQTIPLASATNLDNGDAYIVTIDRVDSNGVKTPNNREVVIGVLSGTNLINCVRGTEGTAQAHSAGAVVEILMTATHWNKLITGWEVQHKQDGTHGDITADSINGVDPDDLVDLDSAQTLTNKTLGSGSALGADLDADDNDLDNVADIDYATAANATTDLSTLGDAETIDFNAGSNFTGDLDDDITITISNVSNGQRGTISLYYSGAQRTITISGAKPPADGLPDAPASADEVLVLTVWNDGTNTFITGQLFDVS